MAKIFGQLESAQVQNKAADPTNLPDGLLWLNVATGLFKTVLAGAKRVFVFEDTAQTLTNKTLSGAVTAAGGSVVGTTDAQTLTNKTMTTCVTGAGGALVGTTDTQTLSNKTHATLIGSAAANASTGADQTLITPTSLTVRLTGALTSVAGVTAPTVNQFVVFTNTIGADCLFRNNSGSASAANRIITGTGGDLNVRNGASVWLCYDLTNAIWRIVGGSGGGIANIAAKTTTGSIASTDDYITIDATAGNIVLTLPAMILKEQHFFKRLDSVEANTVTIQCAGADLIDGSATYTLPIQYSTLKITGIATNSWGIF